MFDKKIAEAKAYLRIVSPFFASLCEACPVIEDSSVTTACVNENGVIRVSPDFISRLEIAQSAVLLCHEAMHPAWGVFWRSRMSNHDPVYSNIAHDHVVNLLLSSAHPDWSIPGWLCDTRYAGMSYEEVYCAIIKEAQGGKKPSTCGTLGLDLEPSKSPSPFSASDENLWRDRIISAYQAATLAGSVPDSIQLAISSMLQPKIAWRDQIFAVVADSVAKTRTEWGIPDRRSEGLGFYYPSEEGLGLDVSVAIDTSGSVDETALCQASSEILSIAKDAGAECRLIVCDARINGDNPLRDFSPTMIKGGGGTKFTPVFEHLDRHPPRLLIYFTDLMGEFPNEAPSYPVIWAVYSRGKLSEIPSVPFGEVVEIPLSE